MNSPFPASLREENGLMDKIPVGKLGVGDNGYSGEKDILSIPNSQDPRELREFKRRARSRQEAFNARVKNFAILDTRFRHNIKKHQRVFEAISVIVRYQMELGSPLFEV
jgi:hypothetical protein